MKKLFVTLQIEMDVPDEWELVETSEGTEAIKIGENQYLDFVAEPIMAKNVEEDWDSITDEAVYGSILEKIVGEASEMAFLDETDEAV